MGTIVTIIGFIFVFVVFMGWVNSNNESFEDKKARHELKREERERKDRSGFKEYDPIMPARAAAKKWGEKYPELIITPWTGSEAGCGTGYLKVVKRNNQRNYYRIVYWNGAREFLLYVNNQDRCGTISPYEDTDTIKQCLDFIMKHHGYTGYEIRAMVFDKELYRNQISINKTERYLLRGPAGIKHSKRKEIFRKIVPGILCKNLGLLNGGETEKIIRKAVKEVKAGDDWYKEVISRLPLPYGAKLLSRRTVIAKTLTEWLNGMDSSQI